MQGSSVQAKHGAGARVDGFNLTLRADDEYGAGQLIDDAVELIARDGGVAQAIKQGVEGQAHLSDLVAAMQRQPARRIGGLVQACDEMLELAQRPRQVIAQQVKKRRQRGDRQHHDGQADALQFAGVGQKLLQQHRVVATRLAQVGGKGAVQVDAVQPQARHLVGLRLAALGQIAQGGKAARQDLAVQRLRGFEKGNQVRAFALQQQALPQRAQFLEHVEQHGRFGGGVDQKLAIAVERTLKGVALHGVERLAQILQAVLNLQLVVGHLLHLRAHRIGPYQQVAGKGQSHQSHQREADAQARPKRHGLHGSAGA